MHGHLTGGGGEGVGGLSEGGGFLGATAEQSRCPLMGVVFSLALRLTAIPLQLFTTEFWPDNKQQFNT